jgi:hypothetical protein
MNTLQIVGFALLATALSAQPSPEQFQRLLPPGAQIVETADLSTAIGKPRALVLWMLNRREVVREHDGPFDRKRQMFVDRQSVTKYPDPGSQSR